MNKIFLYLASVTTLIACNNRQIADVQKVDVKEQIVVQSAVFSDTLKINPDKSVINWTATEMRGAVKRTGKINFKSGYLLLNNQNLQGGYFQVDMKTMDVTDIPAHETVAKANLIKHLKSKDFFHTSVYPVSSLEITSIILKEEDVYEITANLTIREVTKSITFIATQYADILETRFKFDRFKWNIGYQGSWANKTFIDKEIELHIKIAR